MDRELRELNNQLVNVLNKSRVPAECKRVMLLMLAKECELQANENISQEIKQKETIIEKGDMDDGR